MRRRLAKCEEWKSAFRRCGRVAKLRVVDYDDRLVFLCDPHRFNFLFNPGVKVGPPKSETRINTPGYEKVYEEDALWEHLSRK